MQPLDLKNFVWSKNHEWFLVLAIVTYNEEDIVVYRENKDRSRICVTSVDKFCREFQATYELFDLPKK